MVLGVAEACVRHECCTLMKRKRLTRKSARSALSALWMPKIPQTGFGEPGKGAPHGDKTTCAAEGKFESSSSAEYKLRPKYALAAMRGVYLFRLNRDPPATGRRLSRRRRARPCGRINGHSHSIMREQPKQQRRRCRGNQSEKEFDQPPHNNSNSHGSRRAMG